MPRKATREKDLYEPIAEFLRHSWGCSKTWRVGQKPAIKLAVTEPQDRIPDVVGARQVGDSWQTVIVEAKHAGHRGHGLREALNQLEALAPYADHLFMAMADDDWNHPKRNDSTREQIRAEVNGRGVGLLLVSGRAATCEWEPVLNARVRATKRDEILEVWLELPPDVGRRVPGERLSPAQSAVAARQLGIVDQFLWEVEGVWYEHLGKPKREEEHTVLYTEYRLAYPIATIYRTKAYDRPTKWDSRVAFCVEGDPFGYHLRDGAPYLWVWLECPVKRLPTQFLTQARGWYYYARGDGDSRADRIDAVDLEAWRQAGFSTDLSVGRPIALWDRTRASVLAELREILQQTTSKKFQAALKSALG